MQLAFAYAVYFLKTWNAALHAYGFVTLVAILAHMLQAVVQILAVGMAINQDLLTASAAQQLIQRHVGGFGLDIPQRHIHGGDRGHGDRSATPVGAAIKILPDIFNPACIPAD